MRLRFALLELQDEPLLFCFVQGSKFILRVDQWMQEVRIRISRIWEIAG